MSIPQGYLSIDGVSPEARQACSFIVARQKAEDLQRYGPSLKFHDMALLPECLQNPDAIFKGLKRQGLNNPFCYSKSPTRRFQSFRIELPPPPGMVFLVMIDRDHRGYVVLDWEMRKIHPGNSGHPLGWETDFEERLWPKH